jgi:RNA polymerase sigma-70 factor, ECF subfamily
MSETEAALGVFNEQRPRLHAIAYRMLGTAFDADDVVQECWLRFAAAGTEAERPEAWLTTVITRLSIDRLRSAQRRRETYVGPWLAEPVVADVNVPLADSGPESSLLLSESLTFGFLAVLERLSPLERAVFLLHDVFAVPLAEVAVTIERSDSATRQLAKRAREHVRADRPRYAAEPDDVEALTEAFFLAAFNGDLVTLETLLHDDVVQINDGGPDYRASRHPIVGRRRVARFMIGTMKKMPTGAAIHRVHANGQFGYFATVDDQPVFVIVVLWVDGRLASCHGIRNLDKLQAFHQAWRRTA